MATKEQVRAAIGRYLCRQRIADGIAWDDDFWVDSPMSGSAHYVSNETPDEPRVILVPDGAGDYREHRVIERPKGRLGF